MDHQEVLGDTRRSELHSPTANWPAELHGGPEPTELESPDNTPKIPQGKFAGDTSKQRADDLGIIADKTARLNAST
jgi:hypothetical protein